MKALTTLTVLLPGAALAHGGHPPLAGASHAGVHGMIATGFALAFGLIALRLWRVRQ